MTEPPSPTFDDLKSKDYLLLLLLSSFLFFLFARHPILRHEISRESHDGKSFQSFGKKRQSRHFFKIQLRKFTKGEIDIR